MAKAKFDLNAMEEKWQKYWEKEKIFQFDSKSKKPLYSVDMPPPTISGRLHMGHAFGDAQQDFFIRYKRMKGFNILNPFGTDDNGLPTLRLIEKEKKVDSRKMKREDFIRLCLKTIKEEFIPEFVADAKRLGISADWNLFYSTIDKRSRRLSQWSFIDLHKKKRAYRIESPVVICPQCKTAIAQVEMEDADFKSQLVYIKVNVETGDELIFATTRPELLPACMGISVHPDDKRYKHLIGKKVKMPLTGREVILTADEEVDSEYGSGVVYYCSYGGMECVEWLTRHPEAKPIHVMGTEGVYNEKAGKYKGMTSRQAREEIVKDLKKIGALVKTENIKHSVNVHERCGTEIEYVSTRQWFIKYIDLKKKMLKWGGEVIWHPKHMKIRYDNWVNGLKWDWCISRQIPFGIPFPLWYCKGCGEVILADEKQLPVDPLEDKPPVKQCPKCKSKEFIPEKDIMNTWATSALTPSIVKDILKETTIYNKIKNKPMSIRRNGQDIITFWDFNTIVKSQLHFGIMPWKELYINGWILGRDGHKMSKSRGNGVPPQEVIEKWGADSLRYLSASINPGDATAFSDKELVAGKKFVNKILNASRFVFMHLKQKPTKPKALLESDRLFLHELDKTINVVSKAYENYECSRAKFETDNFFWKDFTDNYLELVKDRVYNGSKEEKESAFYALYQALWNVLKMMAPITPFITEEIYQAHFKRWEKVKSIHISEWPGKIDVKIKKDDSKKWMDIKKLIAKIRQVKSDAKKSVNTEINLNLDPHDLDIIKDIEQDFKSMLSVKELGKGKFKVKFV